MLEKRTSKLYMVSNLRNHKFRHKWLTYSSRHININNTLNFSIKLCCSGSNEIYSTEINIRPLQFQSRNLAKPKLLSLNAKLHFTGFSHSLTLISSLRAPDIKKLPINYTSKLPTANRISLLQPVRIFLIYPPTLYSSRAINEFVIECHVDNELRVISEVRWQ